MDAPLVGVREPMPDEAAWHLGWAVGMAAGVGVLLLAVGAVSAQALQALGFMALPGIIGGLWRPKTEERFALLALWGLGAALAVCASGGLAGPLAVLCVTPVLACMVLGASWRGGAGISIAVVLFCALAHTLRMTAKLPPEPSRSWLTLIALIAAAAAAGGALLVARRRAEAERDEVEDELAAFQTLLGDLPDLGLAMDAHGRTEAVFGQPLAGLDMAALHAGLVQAVSAADKPKLDAAIAAALNTGSAQTWFTAPLSPDKRIAVSLQRTSAGGLAAILRDLPSPPRAAPVATAVVAAAAVPSVEILKRLHDAEAGRRDAESSRDKAEANAASRALFLANMSHELRTPLNAIMGFSDMMRAKMFGELPPKYAEYAELIHESGGHLLDLINDVLDMSKIEAQRYTLSREVFDVRDALNAALRLMRLQADDAGVKLRAVTPDAPLMINADKRAIKQIALNLLSNALKFTPKDGSVILTAKAVGADLEMVVADTGVGIAADDLKRLGQPFEQAGAADDRARGTGLGLSLVDAFAKLHGGALTLESRLGEGTAATVRMPVLAPTPQVERVQTSPALTSAVQAPAVHDPVENPPSALKLEPAATDASHPSSPDPDPIALEPRAAQAAETQPIEAAEAETPAIETGAFVAPLTPPSQAAALIEQVATIGQTAAAPDPQPSLPNLGPLDARVSEHHGLRQTVIDIFSRRVATRGAGPSPDDPPQGPTTAASGA